MFANNYIGSQKQPKFEVIQMTLSEVAGYSDQYLRPLKTTMTNDIQTSIENFVDRYNDKVPTGAVAKSAHDFILPSSRPDTINNRALGVTIANGWREYRYVFVLKVKTTLDNLERIELVTGYTDHADSVKQGNTVLIDPKTVFYINSVSTISERTINGVMVPSLKDCYSVLGGGLGSNTWGGREPNKMTPSEMTSHLDVSAIDGFTSNDASYGNTRTFLRKTGTVGSIPSLTSRKNNSPISAATNYINTFCATAKTMNYQGTYTPEDIINKVRQNYTDPGILSSPFLRMLTVNGGTMASTFTYGWLGSVEPFLEDKVMIWDTPFYSNSAYWDGSTRETIMAVTAANVITEFMVNYSLSTLAFISSNHQSTGFGGFGPKATITEITKLSGLANNGAIDYRPLIYGLKDEISSTLGSVLSSNDEVFYHIEVDALMNHDIRISISFENQPMEDYVFPSFADALISPIMTTDMDIYRNNARDLALTLETVKEREFSNSIRRQSIDVAGHYADEYAPAPSYANEPFSPRQDNDGFSTNNKW